MIKVASFAEELGLSVGWLASVCFISSISYTITHLQVLPFRDSSKGVNFDILASLHGLIGCDI